MGTGASINTYKSQLISIKTYPIETYPMVGLGTYKIKTQELMDITLSNGFANNYKMIDTAEIYKNQKYIGHYLKTNNILRTSIWITTKVSFASMKYSEQSVIEGIAKTFSDLDTDYIDLYLIHAPIKSRWLFTWGYLRSLQKENKIRHIGVSNFTYDLLNEFIQLIGSDEAKYIYSNQIEFNPFLNRANLISLCEKFNIKVCAYGSLYKSNELICDIGKKYNKTPEQVLLKWAIQKNIHVIPMSFNPEYIKSNIDLNFTIEPEFMEQMEKLDSGFSLYPKYL